MEWWQIFGIIFLVFAVLWVYSQFAEAAENRKQGTQTVSSTRNNMLQKWDETEVALELNKLQDRPRMLVHYVDSVRQRFIEKQDVKTAAVRIAFLEKKVSLLRLQNDYEDLQKELALRRHGFDNEIQRINLENQKIRLGFKEEATEKELQRLENEARLIEKQLELAKLKKELETFNNPPEPERRLSDDEIKEKKRKDIKKRIQSINEQIAEATDDSSIGEDERRSRTNQLERKKFDLNEEILDLL